MRDVPQTANFQDGCYLLLTSGAEAGDCPGTRPYTFGDSKLSLRYGSRFVLGVEGYEQQRSQPLTLKPKGQSKVFVNCYLNSGPYQ